DEVKIQLAKFKERSEVPDSTYVRDTDLSKTDKQGDFVRALRSSDKLKAGENVAITSFRTEPDQVGQDGDVYNLPPSPNFELRVTVTNKGNLRAQQIQVRAQLVSSVNPTGSSDSDTIDALDPQDSKVVVLRNVK